MKEQRDRPKSEFSSRSRSYLRIRRCLKRYQLEELIWEDGREPTVMPIGPKTTFTECFARAVACLQSEEPTE